MCGETLERMNVSPRVQEDVRGGYNLSFTCQSQSHTLSMQNRKLGVMIERVVDFKVNGVGVVLHACTQVCSFGFFVSTLYWYTRIWSVIIIYLNYSYFLKGLVCLEVFTFYCYENENKSFRKNERERNRVGGLKMENLCIRGQSCLFIFPDVLNELWARASFELA